MVSIAVIEKAVDEAIDVAISTDGTEEDITSSDVSTVCLLDSPV